MTELVQCRDCRHFTKDIVGSGEGLGVCAVLAEASNNYHRHFKVFRECGCKLPWHGTNNKPDRYCKHFQAKKEVVVSNGK